MGKLLNTILEMQLFFTYTNNWKNGYFTYSWLKAAGAHSNQKATGTAGHSLFWKIEKR
mgnify:FL=1|jgi:hypothetical protein